MLVIVSAFSALCKHRCCFVNTNRIPAPNSVIVITERGSPTYFLYNYGSNLALINYMNENMYIVIVQ